MFNGKNSCDSHIVYQREMQFFDLRKAKERNSLNQCDILNFHAY